MEKKNKIKFNIIIIIAIILFSISTITKTFQEDTYYMIKVGEYICENGMQVIHNNIEPFSWLEDMKYSYPHWLLNVIFYLLYSLFNYHGIYAFTLIIGIITYLLIYYTNIKVGKNNIISAIITIASIYLLTGYIAARGQIITYVCLILTLLFIERYLETGHKRYFIGLILVPILLANCHSALFPMYFVIYLPYIAEYIISFLNKKQFYTVRLKRNKKRLEKLQEKNDETKINKIEKIKAKIPIFEDKINELNEKEKNKDRKIIITRNKNVKWLIIIFIISIFTGLLTPIKATPYTYMIKSIIGNTMNFIGEHQGVTLIHSIPILAVYAIIVVLLFSNKIKIKLQDLFMIIGMGILGLISYKQFPIFLIGTMCIINKLTYMIISDKMKEKGKKFINKILSPKGILYIVLIIVIITLVQYRDIASQNYVDTNEYPVLATKWLKENVDIENMKLFNDFNYGSYLLFQDIPVFIDGRADAYDPVFNGREEDSFLDYMQTTSLQVWYAEIFEKYGITHIITKTDSQFNIFIQRNISYKKIYDDGVFSIYEAVNSE